MVTSGTDKLEQKLMLMCWCILMALVMAMIATTMMMIMS